MFSELVHFDHDCARIDLKFKADILGTLKIFTRGNYTLFFRKDRLFRTKKEIKKKPSII